MNKYILYALFIFFLTVGCTKSKNDEPYYLSFKLNGKLIKHNYPTYSSLKPNSTIPGSYDFQLSSNSDDQTNNIVFTIHKMGTIATGIYTTVDNSVLDASYTIFNNLAIEKTYSVYLTNEPPAYFSINLTGVTETYFRGTFTGSYMHNENIRTDSIRITDGEFFVKRHK